MTNDLVSDMLTRLRNAALARNNFAILQYSKLTIEILKVLAKEGYIKQYVIEKKMESQKQIKAVLKYSGWWKKKPVFSILKRISKPGQRIFASYKDFNKIIDALKYEQGIAIISTSSGIMSHLKASKLKKGGEILCYIG
jgi:small subunit ribosomal protein S8